jgi:AraC family transcriptional regulator of adaptative response/methylated-DNA-[protein]-cysteine methyltransferase
MKAQMNLFTEGLSATVSASSVSDKTALKERIKNTRFKTTNPSFTVNRWAPGDELLPIYYYVEKTSLGKLLIAATKKGVIYLGFITKNSANVIADLKRRFPQNTLTEGTTQWHIIATERIDNPEKQSILHLHLKGTEFQLGIWEKLILIPFGGLTNYKQLGNGENDSRAIGAAVGANPVGYLIPCHRVIRADGNFDGFFWGKDIKAQLLTYEATGDVN